MLFRLLILLKIETPPAIFLNKLIVVVWLIFRLKPICICTEYLSAVTLSEKPRSAMYNPLISSFLYFFPSKILTRSLRDVGEPPTNSSLTFDIRAPVWIWWLEMKSSTRLPSFITTIIETGWSKRILRCSGINEEAVGTAKLSCVSTFWLQLQPSSLVAELSVTKAGSTWKSTWDKSFSSSSSSSVFLN